MKYFILTLLIIILAGGFFIWWGVFHPINAEAESAVFLISRGDSVKTVAENLQRQGLIRSKYFFIGWARYKNKEKQIKAGYYDLSSSMTVFEILEKVSSETGRTKKLITIIEGWTIKDIESYLDMGSIDASLEGYLFPDTYEIFPDESFEDIIKKMQNNFDNKLTPSLEEEIGAQNKTIEEIIIMASILEKEVQSLDDKKIVSGILWKRLENNMLLQVDATIVYLTGKKSTAITKEELAIDSKYNTYKYKGLPPGPISNPGLDSIIAAVYPINTKYWFYLSAKAGETIFSSTYQEHLLAREEYLK